MKTAKQLIAFERKVADLWEAGELPYLLHLSGGNEENLIRIFQWYIDPGDWVLSTHRNHYHYLLAGGDEDVLLDLIKQGKSMFVFDKTLPFMSTSILGGLCGVAAGLALTIAESHEERAVWCFVGDGAEDNGHLYEAVKFVMSRNLPCQFVIEDNNRSVTASRCDRGAQWNIAWPKCVMRYSYRPTYPHAGSGTSKHIVFK